MGATNHRTTSHVLALLLAALGLLSVAVPYVGAALGLDVNVARRLELIDHVIPGAIAAACAVAAYGLLRVGAAARSVTYLLSVGIALLAGLWITATHVPLLLEANRGTVAWGPALWHSLPGLPMLLVAGALFLISPSDDEAPRSDPDQGTDLRAT